MFGFLLKVPLLRICVGEMVIAYVGLKSFLRFVLSKSVIFFLTFKLSEYASLFRFVVFVALVCTCVGAVVIAYVILISFIRFELSESITSLLTFDL